MQKHKETLKVATWNVRTLFQGGKLENVKQEMESFNINLLGLCETRWTSSSDFLTGEHRMIYSGGDKHNRGVGVTLDKEHSKCVLGWWDLSDRVLLVKLRGKPFGFSIIQIYAPTAESSEDELEKFYDTIEKAKKLYKSQETAIVMGNLNAKVGSVSNGDILGKHGLGVCDERGERWIRWCKQNDLVVPRHLVPRTT